MGNKAARQAKREKGKKAKSPSAVAENTSSPIPTNDALRSSPLPPAAPVAILNSSQKSHLTVEETKSILDHFDKICTDEKGLTLEQFTSILGVTTQSLFISSFFEKFAPNDTLTKQVVLDCCSVLSPLAPFSEKLDLSFDILSQDGHVITMERTIQMLTDAIADAKSLNLDLVLTTDQITQIVEKTFQMATLNEEGQMERQAFHALGLEHPNDSNLLTVKVPYMVELLKNK